MSEGRLKYQAGLDGVRALALVAVLAFHDGRLRGGFLGVSTFFTLSGFLITAVLLSERGATGRVSLRRFYARRFRRLVPAAALGVVVAAAVTVVVHDAQTARNFRFDALAALGDVANWRFLWSGRSYANLFAAPSPLLHYWSLALEEQFYFVLAPAIVVLLAITRDRRMLLAGAIGALATASFVDGWSLVRHSVDRAYYGTDTRAVEFLVGAFVAVAVSRRALTRRQSRVVATAGPFVLVALVLATASARVQDAGLFRGGLVAYAFGSAVLVLAACEPGPVRWLCSRAPLRYLGRISYGVYLFHWPVFIWLTPARTGLAPLELTAARVGVTLVIATASFAFVEQPFRDGRVHISPSRSFAMPLAGAFVAAAVLVVGVVAPAPAVTFAPTVSPEAVLASARRVARTLPTRPFPTTASTLPAHQVRRILVVGDSVALTLGRGIERWGAAHAVSVLNDGLIGCSLLNGVEVRGYWGTSTRSPDPCRTRVTWPTLLRQFDPDVVVVLFGAWDVYDASFDHGANWTAPGQASWNRYYASEVSDAARRLSATGARVIWITPPCFAAKPGATDANAPWYDPARVEAARRVAHGVGVRNGMTVTDLVHDMGCPVDFGLRPDGVHYSDAGADSVVARLSRMISEPVRVTRPSR